MKISIISGSHRPNSQSLKVSCYLRQTLLNMNDQTSTYLHDCGTSPLPIWNEEKEDDTESWAQRWRPVSSELSMSDAFIAVTPEWSGMVTPQLKNFFLLCEDGELSHKPGLIVSVSSGRGGSHPIAELRMSSYKNTKINWIPEHLIIQNVKQVMNELEPVNESDLWIRDRSSFALNTLCQYAIAMRGMRALGQLPVDPRFLYGM